MSQVRRVTYFAHVETMALAPTLIERFPATSATVRPASMEPIANGTVDFARKQRAGMTVRALHACTTEQGDGMICFSYSYLQRHNRWKIFLLVHDGMERHPVSNKNQPLRDGLLSEQGCLSPGSEKLQL